MSLRLGHKDGTQVTFVIPGELVATDGYNEGDGYKGRYEQLLKLSGWIDVESRLTVGTPLRMPNVSLTILGWLRWGIDLVSPTTSCGRVLAW